MNNSWDFKSCKTVLTDQIGLLKKISAAEGVVRKAVMRREWADFDEKTREVNRLGGEFAKLEEERADLFSGLASLSGNQSFYSSITALPSEERHELSSLYRELKMETFKMRALNETFLVYLNEARTLTSAYLEAVCPARGGKLYTRKGCKASQDLKSIVFNNRF